MNGFALLPKLTVKARGSRLWLWLLNFVLGRLIPFNRPHGFRILELGEDFLLTTAPYRRKNHNHLRGIHACAIATVAEFSGGYLLLSRLDPQKYRLIMSKIEVDYVYQAKEAIVSESRLEIARMKTEILDPLREQESVSFRIGSRIADVSGNPVAQAYTTWQIKRWDRVRTKI
ncbi:MAG: DUF4442 domain-containing protein [Desulfoprunum sp.]|nr:DUF4442 domain-containing protein [Desulfoprunum sp.]